MGYGSAPPMKSTDKGNARKGKPVGSRLAFDATKQEADKAKKKKPLKPLTESQKSQLEKHKVHHSAKHMAKMRLLMREGKSFKQSHAIAMKMVGK